MSFERCSEEGLPLTGPFRDGILAFGALALCVILHMTTGNQAAGSELRDQLLFGIAYILGMQ